MTDERWARACLHNNAVCLYDAVSATEVYVSRCGSNSSANTAASFGEAGGRKNIHTSCVSSYCGRRWTRKPNSLSSRAECGIWTEIEFLSMLKRQKKNEAFLRLQGGEIKPFGTGLGSMNFKLCTFRFSVLSLQKLPKPRRSTVSNCIWIQFCKTRILKFASEFLEVLSKVSSLVVIFANHLKSVVRR